MSETFPTDPEGDLRTWLRSLPDVQAVVLQRVFFQVPDDAEEEDYPLVTVQRIGGAGDTSDAAIDSVLLQIDVVGARRGKQVAGELATVIREKLRALQWAAPTAWGASLVIGVSVESVVSTTDPSDSRPRYVLTVTALLAAGP